MNKKAKEELEGIYCPMAYNNPDASYHNYCIKGHCAWWVEVNEGSLNYGNLTKVGRCAITQLAITINCEVKMHE
jgi:hypothetical protein